VDKLELHLNSLIEDVKQAQDNFNNANEDYINIVTYELLAAEEKLNNYIREKKLKEVTKKTFQPPTEKVK